MPYNKRKSGILLHISSLPSDFGIGDIGQNARKFSDFLASSGFSIWQILPITPVSGVFGYSPYSSPSAFAANSLLICPYDLAKDGLIEPDSITSFKVKSLRLADYEYAKKTKETMLNIALCNFLENPCKFKQLHLDFENFKKTSSYWLRDFALFSALKERYNQAFWNEWPNEYRLHDEDALLKFAEEPENARVIEQAEFNQFIFMRQWNALHEYCKDKGISLVGDMPMFVALDSSDVWGNKELFDLDSDMRPNCVAGVPPDYFSATGQRWGNPLYDWDKMEKDGFKWWNKRMAFSLETFDMVRVDHFRGFCGAWAIPSSEDTAINGSWHFVPGQKLFCTFRQNMAKNDGQLPLIAEDLGIITDDVRALMDDFGLPGMKVLLFAFGEGVGTNPYAPHNIDRNSVVYTGTHDNNTALGWWKNEASSEDKRRVRDYAGHEISDSDIANQMTAFALSSVSDTAIIPIQDILSQDSDCRMNTPSTSFGNWLFRLTQEEFDSFAAENSELSRRYSHLNSLYGRKKG